jgi:hypothetical protein
VLHLRLIILSIGDDVPVDSETLLVTDFVNLEIKPVQSFRCAHRYRVYVCVFIEVSVHMCMSIYVCTVFLKNHVFHQAPCILEPRPWCDCTVEESTISKFG